jgi:hypothetical protein
MILGRLARGKTPAAGGENAPLGDEFLGGWSAASDATLPRAGGRTVSEA